MVEVVGSAVNTTTYAVNTDNQLTSSTASPQGLTVTGYVYPGPLTNKWYDSVAESGGVTAGVCMQNGTFSLPGVPVIGGANALTVTVTDVSGNMATQVVNVTIGSGLGPIGYDANGNQTNDAVWSYAYDAENHLVSATSASSAVYYAYDALGRLIERRTSGASATTNRLYYAAWQLIAEYDGLGNLQRKYVYGRGIDEPVRMAAGGTNYYYHADALGNVSQISDLTGATMESYAYDVYGTPTIYNSGAVLIGTSAVGNRLLFTARDRDPDTGCYDYRYRYYNPSSGRFVQTDPIRLKGGDLNLYGYARNQPSSLVDPTGLDIVIIRRFHNTYGVTDPNSPSGMTYFDYGPDYKQLQTWPVYSPGIWVQDTDLHSYIGLLDTRISTSPTDDTRLLEAFRTAQAKPYNFAVNNCWQAPARVVDQTIYAGPINHWDRTEDPRFDPRVLWDAVKDFVKSLFN
jgi:RHS repeat-associated protein